MKKEIKHIPLNLTMGYPVAWSKYKVFRDFIQNFFDSEGPEKFGERFAYEYKPDQNVLIMQSPEEFSYEWLCYIGASTKRDGGTYAGQFGEGFKIAALCAYRDFHYQIVMESGAWKLFVTEDQRVVDETNVSILTYQVEENCRPIKGSKLTLFGISDEDYEKIFLSVLNDFEYRDNPRFGDCLMDHSKVAVYKSRISKDGALFIDYQERCKLYNSPIIFCYRNGDIKADRDRSDYDKIETIEILKRIVMLASPDEALAILRQIENQWIVNKQKNYSFIYLDWSGTIEILIHKIALNEKTRKAFSDEFGKKYAVESSVEELGKARYQILMSWYRNDEEKNRILLPKVFEEIGIPCLESLCEEANGFELSRDPDDMEKRMIEQLKNAARSIFGDFICYDELPDTKLIKGKKTGANGRVLVNKVQKKTVNPAGLRVIYEFAYVELDEKLFCEKNSFAKAFTVYMHELLHQFGGDSSKQFHNAILELNRRCMSSYLLIQEQSQIWDQYQLHITGEN